MSSIEEPKVKAKNEFVSIADFPFRLSHFFVTNNAEQQKAHSRFKTTVPTREALKYLQNLGWFDDPDTYALFDTRMQTRHDSITPFRVVFGEYIFEEKTPRLDKNANPIAVSPRHTDSYLPVFFVNATGAAGETFNDQKPYDLITSSLDEMEVMLMKRFRSYELDLENGWNPILRFDFLTRRKLSFSDADIKRLDNTVSKGTSLIRIAQLTNMDISVKDAVEIAETNLPLSYLTTAFFTPED